MHDMLLVFLRIMNVSLLNTILSCDNISVIAMTTQKLPAKFARRVTKLGIGIAIVLTIVLTSVISLIMEIEWLPMQLIGGFILLKITVDLLKSDDSNQTEAFKEKPENLNINFIQAILQITLASLALSFDNILAIAGAANGNILVISLGLIISMPVILFGSKWIVQLILKEKLVLYICGAILINTALEMIFSYKYIALFIPQFIAIIISGIISLLFIIYGAYILKKA